MNSLRGLFFTSAAFEAASAVAAVAASATVFAEMKDCGSTVDSMPKIRSGAIVGCSELTARFPSRAVWSQRLLRAEARLPSGRSRVPARRLMAAARWVGWVYAARRRSSATATGLGGPPMPCATIRICGFSSSGRAANSRRTSSATASAAQQERMWRQQSEVFSRRPELDRNSAGAASRHSTIAYSYSARRVSGSFAKRARRRSRIELQPVLAISRRNCASSPRMTRSTAGQLRRVSQAARKSTNPNAAVLKISVASRGSIGGEIEFAETAAREIERDVGGTRDIGSGGVLEKNFEIDGRFEGEDARGRSRDRRRIRRDYFAKLN